MSIHSNHTTTIARAAQLSRDSPSLVVPEAIEAVGVTARFAWEEFILGEIRNPHTRTSYTRAITQFLAWTDTQGIPLPHIMPGDVGKYLDQHSGSIPTKKLALAALRKFFDRLVNRHVMPINPAATVRGERYQVMEGKTPEITADQVRVLMAKIDPDTVVGLRDRAIIGVLMYTAARAGAIAKLKRRDVCQDGTQYLLRFLEKGGKHREIPCRHDLEQFLLTYMSARVPPEENRDTPLFTTAFGKTDRLTQTQMTGIDICRMMKRRLLAAGLPTRFSPHSFRVAVVTDLLNQGVPLADVQYLAGHADPRTTRLYDRRQQKVTRNIVERISL